MSPIRLRWFLNIALHSLAKPLRAHMATQAIRQLTACYPLAGCGITQADGSTVCIIVGRN